MTLRGPAFEARVADWLEPGAARRRILAAREPLPDEDVHADAIAPGEAVRIMTGAPMPPGADTVVRREDADGEVGPGHVLILDDRDRKKNVRPGGQDMRRGDEPRGPEPYADVRAGGGIPESSGSMLAAQVIAAGGVPRFLGIVPGDAETLLPALRSAGPSDVLVAVGGASMGEADLVKRALDTVGFVTLEVFVRPFLPRVALESGPGVAAGETLDVILLDMVPAATDVSPLEGLGP